MQVFTAEQVVELLPMHDCIAAMDDAMRASSAGEVRIPPRMHVPLVDDSGLLLAMPGSAKRYYGAKIIGFHAANPAKGLPAIQGVVILFDHETGVPLAVIDGASVTAIRTAAASGLATRELARTDARTHGIIGTGVQAGTHIDAIASVRAIEEVRIWGRDFEKAKALAESCSDAAHVVAVRDINDAAGCDIVSAVTASTEPVLHAAMVSPGAHINLVGSHTETTREADTALMTASSIFVDSMESAMNEAGDILIPIGEGALSRESIVGEIGQVLLAEAPGRKSAAQITVYKSLGIVAQDLFAAAKLYENATYHS